MITSQDFSLLDGCARLSLLDATCADFFPCHLANLQTISSHLPTSGAHVHDTKSDVTNAHQCTDTLIHSVVCHGVARWCGHDGVPVCSYPNQS